MQDEVVRIMWDLVSKWHDTAGIFGNYYLGSDMKPMLYTVLSYKRLCDNFMQAFKDIVAECDLDFTYEFKDYRDYGQYFELPIKVEKDCLFVEIIEREDLYQALQNAIEILNRINYEAPGYNRIPELPHIQDPVEAKVIQKWFNRIRDYDFSSKNVNEQTWNYIIEQYAKEKRRG